MSEVLLCANWPNPRWQNSRWLTSSSGVRMNEFESDWISLSQSFVQNCWIQDGRIQDDRIQDGCHHQVNQIELVWIRVRVEWECFWVNLKEDNKVSESKMAVSDSNMAEFKMAAIIKFSQNEWVKFYYVQIGLIQDGRIQDGWHHQVEWEWMSLNQIELVWIRVLCKIAESKMGEFKMTEFKKAAINKFIRFNLFESESEWSESVFEWIWEKITRCLNPIWQCLNPT